MSIFSKLVVLLMLSLIAMQAKSQGMEQEPWVLYRANDSIDIYMQTVDCNIPSEGIYRSYVMFKFVNKTNVDLTVDWDYKVWFGNTCYGCIPNDEFHRKVIVKANSFIESTCTKRVNELSLFRKFLSYSTEEILTSFEFYNIKITVYV